MFAFLGGGIVTFIGSIIKFFNAGDILNFYDEKIYDKNKVSKIVGNDIFYTGLGIILIAIISIFLNNKYYYAMMITQMYFILNLCAKFSLKSQPSIYGKYGKRIL